MSTDSLVAPSFDAVTVGDALPASSITVTRADLIRYAGAGGDFNPIHWNERFARDVGLPDVIAHGMLTMALAITPVTGWCADPAGIVEYAVRFTHPIVVPDDDAGAVVEISGTVTSRDEQARTVRVDLLATSAGEKVLGRAFAVVRLP